jgi:hypothetical protein
MPGDSVQDAEDTMTDLVATGISEEVLKVLENQGLPIKRSMKLELPDFPEDITAIDEQQLMIMASKYMENLNFIRTQVACATLAEAEADSAYDMTVAKGLLGKTTGKSTEKSVMLKAAVVTEPEVVELAKAKDFAYAYRKLLETHLENLERYYSLTSRELTRRTSNARSGSFNRYVP